MEVTLVQNINEAFKMLELQLEELEETRIMEYIGCYD
jgi:hypothetical protein